MLLRRARTCRNVVAFRMQWTAAAHANTMIRHRHTHACDRHVEINIHIYSLRPTTSGKPCAVRTEVYRASIMNAYGIGHRRAANVQFEYEQWDNIGIPITYTSWRASFCFIWHVTTGMGAELVLHDMDVCIAHVRACNDCISANLFVHKCAYDNVTSEQITLEEK